MTSTGNIQCGLGLDRVEVKSKANGIWDLDIALLYPRHRPAIVQPGHVLTIEAVVQQLTCRRKWS